MNPMKGCSKGYKKCIKTCHQPEKCHCCPYLKECCHRYCITLTTRSSKATDQETGQVKADPFVECIEHILKGKNVL